MSDQLPVLCRQCGSYSSDPDWCEQCGADLSAQERAKALEWLKPGELLRFDGIPKDWLPSASEPQDFAAARTAQLTNSRIPLPELLAAEAKTARSGAPRDPDAVTPSGPIPVPDAAYPDPGEESVDFFEEAVSEEDVDEGSRPLDALFESIGPEETDTALLDVDEDSADEGSEPIDGLEALEIDVDEASDDDDSDDGGDATVTLEVELLGPREVYSRRRIWLCRQTRLGDDVEEQHFLVEERQLNEGEEAPELEVSQAGPLESSHLYPPLARQMRDNRVLSLYHAPLGQSLFSWRQRQPTPRYSSILTFLRPLVDILEQLHAEDRLHLHLAPQNIWFHQGSVTFTGFEDFPAQPLEDGRLVRAYPGFSAPELFGRSRQEIAPATDVYGLGAIVYYLITGIVPPVAPETAFAPAISPRDFQPSFPLGWVDAVLQATDPISEHRHMSPRQFLDQLEGAAELMQQRATPDPGLGLRAAAERHIGFAKARRSPVNQDNVFLAQNEARKRMLIVVGDGVSTASFGSGDLASACLIKRAEEHWKTIADLRTLPEPERIIADIIYDANRDIVDYVNAHCAPIMGAPSEVMGSTALVAVVEDSTLYLGSLGDSRCYLIRNGFMECVTRDHNLFTLSLVEGISINEVLMMPHGDALARCLGTFDLKADGTLHAINPPFDFYAFGLLPDDNILLCTDGLFDYAGATYEESEHNIQRIVLHEPHPGLACLELILLANRGGGGDNIGVALLKVNKP